LKIRDAAMTTKTAELPKQSKRISPELAEVLHMLKALEAQDAPAKASQAQ
jgi:hypothetical protein